MDTLFENNYTRCDKDVKALYKYVFFQNPAFLVIDLYFAAAFVYGVVNLIRHTDSTFWLICLPIAYLYQFLMYRFSVSSDLKKGLELNGGKPMEVHIEITEEGINNMPYTVIRKAIQTKNYIFLRTNAKMYFILRKNAFTKGTSEEFKAFLRSKGYKIK